MSHHRRHAWFRRLALGLAFAAVIFTGRVSAAAAEFDESPDGSVHVTAGGWTGVVDTESGIPLAAGIPDGDDRVLPEAEPQVIPYLSHGILTERDAKAAFTRKVVRRPDGDEIAIQNAVRSRGELTSEELAFVDAVVGAAESLHDRVPPASQSLRAESEAREQGESSEHLTPEHTGIDYPD